MYAAYQRLQDQNKNKEITIIYLGDHDPSGIDMTHDIDNRLGTFLYGEGEMLSAVHRIALNMDQIEKYNPPKNPAKITDSRYKFYVQNYGESSWELDALDPSILTKIVEDAIFQYIDSDEFERVLEIEKKEKGKLSKIAMNYDRLKCD